MRVSESKSEWSPYTVTEKRPCEGRHSEKVAICKPGRKLSLEFGHAGTVILDFQSPELWENKYLLLKAPSLQYLVMAAQAKTFPFSNSSVAHCHWLTDSFFNLSAWRSSTRYMSSLNAEWFEWMHQQELIKITIIIIRVSAIQNKPSPLPNRPFSREPFWAFPCLD